MDFTLATLFTALLGTYPQLQNPLPMKDIESSSWKMVLRASESDSEARFNYSSSEVFMFPSNLIDEAGILNDDGSMKGVLTFYKLDNSDQLVVELGNMGAEYADQGPLPVTQIGNELTFTRSSYQVDDTISNNSYEYRCKYFPQNEETPRLLCEVIYHMSEGNKAMVEEILKKMEKDPEYAEDDMSSVFYYEFNDQVIAYFGYLPQ